MKTFLIVLSFFGLTSCILDCIAKKTGGHNQSQTLTESKKNDVYKFEMQPSKSTFLLDSGRVFTINNSWVEDNWGYQCVNNRAAIVKDGRSQLVIEAKYNGQVIFMDYWLKALNVRHCSHLGSQLDFDYSGQDTFILLFAKHTMLNQNEDKPVLDTIKFTKKVSH